MSSVVIGMGEEEQAQRPGPSILAYPHQEAVTMLTPSQNNFTRDLYTVSQLYLHQIVSKGMNTNMVYSNFYL